MPAYTYRQFRIVLRKLGFKLTRVKKHETWVLRSPGQPIRRVIVKHQRGRDIPAPIFSAMLRQAGITRKEFAELLRE